MFLSMKLVGNHFGVWCRFLEMESESQEEDTVPALVSSRSASKVCLS